MLAGASLAVGIAHTNVPRRQMPGEAVVAELFAGLIGAFIGVGAELLLRRLLPSNFRFSLRTLLIAMTLIAAVLGLVVWAIK
jgi:hypothetical protein